GSNLQRLTDLGQAILEDRLEWSPDGTRLLFSMFPSGSPSSTFDVYAVNKDGSHLANLTNNPANDQSPTWSPDGTRIAFSSERDGNPEIYVMNADGTHVVRLTHTSEEDLWPVWQPSSNAGAPPQ